MQSLHCHTFENKSSAPANPPTGFDELVPVLLVHPPNSSSAATFGAGANPPDALGTIGWLAKEPQSSNVLLVVVVVVVTVAGLGSGSGFSGVAQALASLQTLASDQLFVESVLKDPRVLVAVVVEVAVVVVVVDGLGLLLDRLNTEAVEVEVIVGEETVG
mgnify:CR=1 FL=1